METITSAFEDMRLDDPAGPEVRITSVESKQSLPSYPPPLMKDLLGLKSDDLVHEAFIVDNEPPSEHYPDPDSLHLPRERSDSFTLAAHLSDSMSVSPSGTQTWAEHSPSVYSEDSSSFDEVVDDDEHISTFDVDDKGQALRSYLSYTASHPNFDIKGRPILSVHIPAYPSGPVEYLGILDHTHAGKLQRRESFVEKSLLRGRAFSLCSTDSNSTRMSISTDPDVEDDDGDDEMRIGDVRQTPDVVTSVCSALPTASPLSASNVWQWAVNVEETRREGENQCETVAL